MPANKKTVVIHSGGLDSTVLLFYLRHHSHDVVSLSFDYGQRHLKELGYAAALCCRHKIQHVEVEIPWGFFKGDSALTGLTPVPHGHYEDESMKKTVVPGRNALFISSAVAMCPQLGADRVAIGVHSGDHAIYPDCRPEFVSSMQQAVKFGTGGDVALLAPFVDWDKRWIVELGRALDVPFEETWTCYEGKMHPCGKCGSCVEREEALS